MRALLLAAPLIVTIFALIDLLLNGSPDRLRGIPKVAWFFLIALIQPAIGALVWLFAGYILPRIEAERRGRGAPPSSPRPTYGGQLAPDDDPDFLFRLKREEWRRRREHERRQRKGEPTTPPEPDEPSGPPTNDEPQP